MASFRDCASKPRLKSSSITSRAPLGPAGVRDLRFFLVLPSAIALITDNPRQRRPSGRRRPLFRRRAPARPRRP